MKNEECIIIEVDDKEYKVVTAFKLEFNGKTYIALQPLTEKSDEIQIFRYIEISDGIELIAIESDGEFELAVEAYYEILE